MNKRYQCLACQALVILLAGCASLNPLAEKKQDYHDARLVKPLEVPPDLTHPSGDSQYEISAASSPAARAPAAPQAPVLTHPAEAPVSPPAMVTAPAASPATVTAPAALPPMATSHAVLTRTNDGAGMLLLNGPMTEAWRRTGMALDKAHAAIEDRNWSQGLYYVHAAPAKVPFWRFWQHRDPAAGELWRVHLARHGDFIAVTVLDDHGQPSDAPTANQLIKELYRQLK